jgi:hypothetical protein
MSGFHADMCYEILEKKTRRKTRVGIPNAALKCSAQKSLKMAEKSLSRESETSMLEIPV